MVKSNPPHTWDQLHSSLCSLVYVSESINLLVAMCVCGGAFQSCAPASNPPLGNIPIYLSSGHLEIENLSWRFCLCGWLSYLWREDLEVGQFCHFLENFFPGLFFVCPKFWIFKTTSTRTNLKFEKGFKILSKQNLKTF